eukprot:2416053-Amphidinium_carterae.1
MQDAPQSDRVRFVGNLQGSVSQALYLTTCALGAIVAVGFGSQHTSMLGVISRPWCLLAGSTRIVCHEQLVESVVQQYVLVKPHIVDAVAFRF